MFMKDLLELFMMIIIALTELLMTKNERTIHQQNINVLIKEIPPLIDVSILQNKL